MRRGPDIPGLVAGLALLAFGAVLLLDSVDAIDMTFAALGPVACAVSGAILLANGLGRRR